MQSGPSLDRLQCLPSAFIPKSRSLWIGKAAVRMPRAGLAPCESFSIVAQASQAGHRRTVRKIYPISTYTIPFSHPSTQSMLRTRIIQEQNKKQLGTNAFCKSIYYLCEPHMTESVRRHGTHKKADCPLQDSRDF